MDSSIEPNDFWKAVVFDCVPAGVCVELAEAGMESFEDVAAEA